MILFFDRIAVRWCFDRSRLDHFTLHGLGNRGHIQLLSLGKLGPYSRLLREKI